MLFGGLARGSPAGSVVVIGLGMSALPVVVVVISGSLVGSCNISGIVVGVRSSVPWNSGLIGGTIVPGVSPGLFLGSPSILHCLLLQSRIALT